MWAGPTSTVGTIRSFVQVRDADSYVTGFSHQGAIAVTLEDPSPGGLVNMTYGRAPPASTVAGTATFPPASLTRLYQYVQFGAGAALQQVVVVGDGAFSLVVPDPAGATQRVCAVAQDTTGYDPPISIACASDLAAPATGVDLDPPAWVVSESPADQVVAPREGPFAWSAPAGGVSLLFVAAQVVGEPSFLIVTGGTSYTIPALDFSIPASPSGTSYAWRVYGYPDVATVDDAATTGFPRGTGITGPIFMSPRWGSSLQASKSESRGFSTP
jgi:hypothetical protein